MLLNKDYLIILMIENAAVGKLKCKHFVNEDKFIWKSQEFTIKKSPMKKFLLLYFKNITNKALNSNGSWKNLNFSLKIV
jgi:hypothetical protein